MTAAYLIILIASQDDVVLTPTLFTSIEDERLHIDVDRDDDNEVEDFG